MIDRLKHFLRQNAPDWFYAPAASLFWLINPSRENIILIPKRGSLQVHHIDRGLKYRVPGRHNIRRCYPEECERKFRTYSYGDELAPQEGDLVVDVGAFVGQFSINVASTASRVVAFEPSPRSFDCLRYNLQEYDNVTCHQQLLLEARQTVSFNIASDGSDNSILTPDDGSNQRTITLEGDRLDKVLPDMGIEDVDFLKMDAEGAEITVLKGAVELEVSKIAVDCSAENDGNTTVDPVASYLRSAGYDVIVDDDESPEIVFGTLSNEDQSA